MTQHVGRQALYTTMSSHDKVCGADCILLVEKLMLSVVPQANGKAFGGGACHMGRTLAR